MWLLQMPHTLCQTSHPHHSMLRVSGASLQERMLNIANIEVGVRCAHIYKVSAQVFQPFFHNCSNLLPPSIPHDTLHWNNNDFIVCVFNICWVGILWYAKDVVFLSCSCLFDPHAISKQINLFLFTWNTFLLLSESKTK